MFTKFKNLENDEDNFRDCLPLAQPDDIFRSDIMDFDRGLIVKSADSGLGKDAFLESVASSIFSVSRMYSPYSETKNSKISEKFCHVKKTTQSRSLFIRGATINAKHNSS